MSVARANHTATRLKDGRVLVVGGASASAEVFTPGVYNDPPVAVAPTTGLVVGRLGPRGGIPLKVEWSASDSDGVASYELQQSFYHSGPGWATIATTVAPTTSITRMFASNNLFRVRAIDQLGNGGNWAVGQQYSTGLFEETDTSISYTGSWTTASLDGAVGGAIKFASAAGATAHYTFTGRSVAWASTKGPDRGKAEVWIDGIKIATVDLYAATTTTRQLVHAHNGLSPSGTHTLEVRVLGTKHASAKGTRVDVDAFVSLR